MKNLLLSFIILAAITFQVKATGENKPQGARSAGMGGSSVVLTDIWSVYNNQAALAGIHNISFATYFSNRFAVKELSTKSFAFALPVSAGTFGLSYSNFGYSLYNENKIGLAFAKQLWNILSVGIQIDYFRTHLGEDYGNHNNISGEIGILAEPIKNFVIGAHLTNPTKTKIADYQDERMPTIFRLGVGYTFSDKVTVSVEGMQELDEDIVFKTGIEYNIVKNLYLRTGISTNPVLNSFGLGLLFKNFKADMAFSKHPVLGYSTHFSLSYQLGGKKKSNAEN